MRHRCYAESEAPSSSSSSTQHIDQRNSLINLNTSTFSLAETKEEYDEDPIGSTTDQIMNTLNAAKATLQQEQYFNSTILSRNFNSHNNNNHVSSIQKASNNSQHQRKSNETPKDIYNLNSIEKIDLILEDKSLTKAIHVSGAKCFVTKKIRRLGKYFPVINFS